MSYYLIKKDPNIKFPFKYQAIVLKDCGHYELLQSPENDFDKFRNDICTPCVYKRIG